MLILVRKRRRLIVTITAFTIAHSLTFAAATFGPVRVPRVPVDVAIARSIVFVAVEILHGRQGLPETAVPVVLLFFNLGVEAGQIAVVPAITLVTAVFRTLGFFWSRCCGIVSVYALGTIAMCRTTDRTFVMVVG